MTITTEKIGTLPKEFNEYGASAYTDVKLHVDMQMNNPERTHRDALLFHRTEAVNTMKRLEFEIRELAENKRKKNKAVTMEMLAELQKATYNAHAYDFFLWCVYGHGGEIYFPSTMREGARERIGSMNHQTQHMLFLLNQYSGYNIIHWIYGGFEAWQRDGEPKRDHTNDKYCREDLGVFFY